MGSAGECRSGKRGMGNGRMMTQSPGGGDCNIVSSGQSSLPLGYISFPRCCLNEVPCQIKKFSYGIFLLFVEKYSNR